MNVLVTGGAGAVGSHLVERLLLDGHDVDVVDDLSVGRLANLADARRTAQGHLSVPTLDVCAPEFGMLVARRSPSVIVHLAAAEGPLPHQAAVATGGLVAVLAAAATHQVHKVVVTVSAHLYGSVAARDLPIRERHAAAPCTPAGLLAQAALAWLATFRDQHQVEYTALVTGSVYGPRVEHGVVAAMRRSLVDRDEIVVHGDGRQVRDLVHVDDVVDALARSITKGTGVPVNVGTGEPTQVRQLARLLAAARGVDLVTTGDVRSPGDPERLVLDPGRARIHLGWTPFTDLADGLARLVPPVGPGDEASGDAAGSETS